jgi:hypothetical protein
MSCLNSANQVVDRVVVEAEPIVVDAVVIPIDELVTDYPILREVINSEQEAISLLRNREDYLTDFYMREANELYLERKTIEPAFQTIINEAKNGGLGVAIKTATMNMESELNEIFKILSITAEEAFGHRWIATSRARINAYMHMVQDTYKMNEEQYDSLRNIAKAFKTDFQISTSEATVLNTYGHQPHLMKLKAAEKLQLFTSAVEKIPNYEGFIVRHTEINAATQTALTNAFNGEQLIKLETLLGGKGYTNYILAGSPVGGTLTFTQRPCVFLIRSKTGRYITPLAKELEPEIVIVGASKQFKVKNILKGVPRKTWNGEILQDYYFLEEQ